MGAMGRAKRVVHVEVGPLGELAREGRIVFGLAGMEARVLEHGDALIVHECAQVRLDRLQRERRVLALRPAQVRTEPQLLRATVEDESDRRQRGADPRVVRNAPVLERNVEIHAGEDVLPAHIGVPDRARPMHYRRRCDRSTSRQL